MTTTKLANLEKYMKETVSAWLERHRDRKSVGRRDLDQRHGDRHIGTHGETRSIAEAVCDSYRMRILESGHHLGVAGAPCMMWSPGRTFLYDA